MNRTFRKVIDCHVSEAWFKVFRKDLSSSRSLYSEIDKAVVRPNLYVLERALISYRWHKSNWAMWQRGIMFAIPDYNFMDTFTRNQNRTVNELFLKYFDVNSVYHQYIENDSWYVENTVLIQAIRQGNLERVRFLVAKGAKSKQWNRSVFSTNKSCLGIQEYQRSPNS